MMATRSPPSSAAQQQLQQVGCVPRICLLFAHHPGPDLGGIPNPQLVSHLGQHAFEPARVSGDFDPTRSGPLNAP
jgi:hypothetical protein